MTERKDVYAGSPTGQSGQPQQIQIGVGTVMQPLRRIVVRKRRKPLVRRHGPRVRAKLPEQSQVKVQLEGKGLIHAAERFSALVERLQTQMQSPERKSSVSVPLRPLPDCRPDGTDIANLDELAVLMGVSRKIAPYFVMEQKDRANMELIDQARREIRVNIERKAMAVNGQQPSGVAIMAMVSQDDAERLAHPDGEPPENLHCTLGYLENPAAQYTDQQKQSLIEALQHRFATFTPIQANAFATANFNPDDDEREPCAVLLVQSEDLAKLKETVIKAMQNAMVSQSDAFPIWIPHVAIAYNTSADQVIDNNELGPITFDRVTVGWAGENIVVTPESKARVIRTAAGARRYGKPIGTVLGGNDEIDLYHRTSAASAEQIHRTGKMVSRENTGEVYFSTHREGQGEGYGDAVVHVRVPRKHAELDDEFPSGEQHYRVHARHITKRNIVRES